MTTWQPLETSESASPWRDLLGFLTLVATGLALAFALWRLTGPPPIPKSAPDIDYVVSVLQSSEVPDKDVVYVARVVGWLALGYMGLSMALRALLVIFYRLTDGATWSAAALAVSEVVTLPPVRRGVDGALLAVVVASLWLRAKPGLAAEPVLAAAGGSALHVAKPNPHLVVQPPVLQTLGLASEEQYLSYTVVEGDSLWAIARRFYGDGSRYPLIFEANKGRVMTTGQAFTDPRLIRPGWVLDVPLPAHNVQASDGHVTYRVQSGDSLWCIAERLLGDGFRWIEIWRLNEGREMAGGVRFTNADIIHPGWQLELPIEAKTEVGAPPAEPTEATPARTPEPEPPEPLAELEPAMEPTSMPERVPASGDFQVPVPDRNLVLATAAGLVAAGGVVLTVRAAARRWRRDRVKVTGARDRGRRPHGDAGKVVVAARALLSGLAELGFDDVRLLGAREVERYTEFLLECAPGDANALARAEYDLGRQLACRVNGQVEDSTHVHVKLSSFQRLAGLLVGDRAPDGLLLVPVGSATDGVRYLNLAAAGAVLVAGDRRETREVVSAWAATLAATHAPDELTLLPSSELGDESGGPDMPAGPAEDADGQNGRWLTAELRDALGAREGGRNPGGAMPVVAFVGLPETWTSEFLNVETLLHHGPTQGIYVVAVAESTADAEGVGPFGASVVFTGAATGSVGEEPEGEVESGDLTLSVGHRPPVVLQPIAVRKQTLPSMRPMSDRELDEWWEQEKRWGERQTARRDSEAQELEEASPWENGGVQVEEDSHDEGQSGQPEPTDDAGGEMDQNPTAVVSADDREAGGWPSTTEELAPDEYEVGIGTNERPYRVQCFGSFEVTDAAGRPVVWPLQKARELLAYLVAQEGRSVPREEVEEALWPEAPPTQVERLLSNAAYQLRKAFREPGAPSLQFLTVSGQRYHLRRELFRLDTEGFVAHLRRAEELDGADALAEYERAFALYKGDFLAREAYGWASSYRSDYQSRFVGAAHRAAKLALDLREVDAAAGFYRAILAREALNEEAVRGLLRCYDRLGDLTGIRKVYRAFCESLRRELDDDKAEPTRETKALFEELSRSRAG